MPAAAANSSTVRQALPEVVEVADRPAAAIAAARVEKVQQHAIGIGIRVRLQHDRMHDAEDRRRRADAERERQHRRDREAGLGAALAPGEPQILPQLVEPVAPRP